jgi:hypothetical protein
MSDSRLTHNPCADFFYILCFRAATYFKICRISPITTSASKASQSRRARREENSGATDRENLISHQPPRARILCHGGEYLTPHGITSSLNFFLGISATP